MPPVRGKHADITDALNDIFKAEIKRLDRDWVSRHSSIGVQIPQVSRLALKFIVMTRQGAGGREQGEKGFEPCLLFFTQFGFIAPTYLGRRATSRILDVCVVTLTQWQELQITLFCVCN